MLGTFLKVSKSVVQDPLFVGSTSNNAASGTALTLSYPAGTTTGDLVLAIVVADGTNGWALKTNWSRLFVTNNLDPSFEIYTRGYPGGSSETFERPSSNANACCGIMLAFRGGTNFFAGTPNLQTSGSTRTVGALSATFTAPTDILAIYTSDTASRTFSTPTNFSGLVDNTTRCSISVKRRQNVTGAYSATPSSTISSSTARSVSAQIAIVS
jgi:hypothetical protein